MGSVETAPFVLEDSWVDPGGTPGKQKTSDAPGEKNKSEAPGEQNEWETPSEPGTSNQQRGQTENIPVRHGTSRQEVTGRYDGLVKQYDCSILLP